MLRRLSLPVLILLCTLAGYAQGPTQARIHYYRPDAQFAGWGLHVWNNTTDNVTWTTPLQPAGSDSYGIYFDVDLFDATTPLGFIIHKGDTKDPGPDMYMDVTQPGRNAWIISGDSTIYYTQPTKSQLLSANFHRLQAYWIDRNTIAIQAAYFHSGDTVRLHSDLSAGLAITDTGLTGGQSTLLTPDPSGLTPAQLATFPQLNGYAAFHLQNARSFNYAMYLKGQVAVSDVDSAGNLTYATGVQTPGVLDDLYFYSGKLGPSFRGTVPTVSVWAPTAQSVALQLFNAATDATPTQVVPMHESNGVWSVQGKPQWKNKYYLFNVKVYTPFTFSVVENVVTDPWSLGLSLNSTKSQIIDLDDASNKPLGWDLLPSPPLASWNDLSIYELHIRDFSATDSTIPAVQRGTYLAFTDQTSNGMKHLRSLSQSGLRAVHLLPNFDIASVNEDKTTWKTTGDLSVYPPDSDQQQAAVAAIQGQDGFNWGYDPLHYLTPEGSYAVNAASRTKEYRAMVESLHANGLRVIQDVVFNHTSSFGQNPNSVLDEVVPDYYYRLDANGANYFASCCADTATEHRMMEKLMIDAVTTFAKEYKVDGFRFDIMSFHLLSNIQHVRQALDQLTLRNDGVDGRKVYLYGEGWNFGETGNNALGKNAMQSNLYGTGIGSFNDRTRDGVRGGGPFNDVREQGFATGLFTDPNTTFSIGDSDTQKAKLLQESDWIRIGLTGNLRDYSFTDSNGNTVTGGSVDYNGQHAGYTAQPIEDISYASAHDNQTIFDAVQLKSNITDSIADRTRRQNLANSLILLGQGIPFFHAGDDILRSKSGDNNSYDSGDWFNKIDWTLQTDNWGVGLPIASQNSFQWSDLQPLLADPALMPQPANIQRAYDHFCEMLRVRYSSPLFRMSTEPQIQANLRFLNVGPNQIPGVIAVVLGTGRQQIVVVFNGSNASQTISDASLANLRLQLHPVLQHSTDPVVKQSTYNSNGSVTVPALTTAVFTPR
ncbi:Alpha-1,6-glucosidase, pullulanase-type [Candidatus Koribacter versatilis Ellin345]|uniref:pullulanase n=1 Tax=Koribacter versatilis (strain Ellin345) TaxID=204669 RepID=Q1IP70_KORVE|nr:pullulanase-type alpha-1,6-glucosidase [Candidatus Koribacter versatilis]ABF41330.1 Alpha-1,6-glucosidase, pullulanase-type [Candidatus Koribacter versatilis Ellin345]